MNINLYNQLAEIFSFVTGPLWELYNSYDVISGPPFLGVALLGLMASVYPSQIIGALVFAIHIVNQTTLNKDWWKMAGVLFLGSTLGGYFIIKTMHVLPPQGEEVLINGGRSLVSLLLVSTGIVFFIPFLFPGKKWTEKVKKLPSSLIYGLLVGFVTTLSMGSETVDLFPMLIYSFNQHFIFSLLVPLVFTFSSLIFVWTFSILGYGYKLDIFLYRKLVDRRIEWYFGLVMFILGLNHMLIYW